MLKFPSPHVALLASAVFGFAVGVTITLPALIIQHEYPPIAFGMLSALTLAIIQIGNACGPSILGWLRDVTGSYAVPIMVCMALEIVAIATYRFESVSPERRSEAREGVARCSFSRLTSAY